MRRKNTFTLVVVIQLYSILGFSKYHDLSLHVGSQIRLYMVAEMKIRA